MSDNHKTLKLRHGPEECVKNKTSESSRQILVRLLTVCVSLWTERICL